VTEPGRLIPAVLWRRQAQGILKAWGMSDEHAATTADVLTAADLMGVDSHGLALFDLYEKQLQEGGANPRPEIRLEIDRAAVALINADASFGQVPSMMAVDMASSRAETYGISAISIRNSNHYGAAGVYARRLAERGLIGISASSVWRPAIVPTGGIEPKLGTNPIAVGAPCTGARPFLLDMATSAAAIGKLRLAQHAETPLPEGWALARDGRPERDATRALLDVLLVPLGGHKGYGLATMVEILSSTLSGSAMAPMRGKPSGRHDVGHLFLAIDPSLLRGSREAFADDMARMTEALRATPAADEAAPVMVAGDPQYLCEDERLAQGIPLPPQFEMQLREIAQRAGTPFILEEEEAALE
jgi:LDH2 family malate/lactate/ureidoglycolate dehydrogenase